MNHAPLAPSSAARIEACPGSVAMEAPFPDEETDDTLAGDAVHWAGAAMLQGVPVALGQVAPNGVTLTVEKLEAAEEWAGYIITRNRSFHSRAVETVIVNEALHPDNWGTPDNREYLFSGDLGLTHIFVDDLKYGHGFVDAVGNMQLVNYAVLALFAEFGAAWVTSDILVTMTIFQPRCYRVGGFWRSWTVKAFELVPYAERLRLAYRIAMKPNAPCLPNPECRNCKARHDCTAALMAGYNGVDVTYAPTPLRMSPEAKAVAFRTLSKAHERITAVMTGLEADIKASIGRGVRVPGYLIEGGAGATVWSVEKEEVKMLGEMLGVPLTKEDSVTPLQAATALKRAKLDPAIIDAYSTTIPGKAKLIESSASMAAKAFKQE